MYNICSQYSLSNNSFIFVIKKLTRSNARTQSSTLWTIKHTKLVCYIFYKSYSIVAKFGICYLDKIEIKWKKMVFRFSLLTDGLPHGYPAVFGSYVKWFKGIKDKQGLFASSYTTYVTLWGVGIDDQRRFSVCVSTSISASNQASSAWSSVERCPSLLYSQLMWSETVGLRARMVWGQENLVLVLQVWCCVVKHGLVTFVLIMILKDTATFQVLCIVSLLIIIIIIIIIIKPISIAPWCPRRGAILV